MGPFPVKIHSGLAFLQRMRMTSQLDGILPRLLASEIRHWACGHDLLLVVNRLTIAGRFCKVALYARLMKKKYDEDTLAKTFMPAVIRRYRDAAGLSQQELADQVGISKSYISSLELGYRAPSLNLLVKIAQTLGIKPGKMIDEMVDDAEKGER